MYELTDLNLDTLRVELAYRRALLTGEKQPAFRAKLPRHRVLRVGSLRGGRN